MTTYTALFPFCGLGSGARGVLDAEVRVLGDVHRFRSLGGFDIDPLACADFETLTDSPAWCVDLAGVTPMDLRSRYGDRAPDFVFMSPPCKGFSGLLSPSRAADPKYLAMNRLALTCVELLLRAWNEPPGLLLFENVPRIAVRGLGLLAEVRTLLRTAGYQVNERNHDCGKVGGLAQHRLRYLLVARHAKRVPPLLFKPSSLRVRACGEVLGLLPLPEDLEAGPMHRLPKVAWKTWLRLAMIPAGGDWRDLPGVLGTGEKRRKKWARQDVADWNEPTRTVAGNGSNGASAVADPRFKGSLGVQPWTGPSGTVCGESWPHNGAFSVADPRILELLGIRPDDARHWSKFRVEDWEKAARTVTGSVQPESGGPSVADPRPREWFPNAYRVLRFVDPAGTVTGSGTPSSGAFTVADPRIDLVVKRAYDHGYRVLLWNETAFTVHGKSHPGCGAYAVGDPRLGCDPHAGAYGVLGWDEASGTVTGSASHDNGRFSVADPRRPPDFVPVILSPHDGTWHRPLTTLELAALQGLPVRWKNAPLALAGANTGKWRERIGNAVPAPAARRMAEEMLVALAHAGAQSFSLGSNEIWVHPDLHASHEFCTKEPP